MSWNAAFGFDQLPSKGRRFAQMRLNHMVTGHRTDDLIITNCHVNT